MKKIVALLMVIVMCVPVLCACGGTKTEAPKTETPTTETPTTETPVPTETPTTETPATETPVPTVTPEDDTPMLPFGVYHILTGDGAHVVSMNAMNKFVLDDPVETRSRFTLMTKTVEVKGENKKYYAIYKGEDTRQTIGISNLLPENCRLMLQGSGYNPGKKELWNFEDNGDGTVRIVPKESLEAKPICLAVKGNEVLMAARDENDPNQKFIVEKAPQNPSYREYAAAGGNIVVRVHKSFFTKSSGITDEFMQQFADFFQEAYEAEVELTGFVPYDLIVVSGWEQLDYVAGVSDNYNVINANRGFMQSEMSNSVFRKKNLDIFDLSFGLLHELGHMFDSNRGWNFESEAWTDLKLCYVIWRMTQKHKDTDGVVFGCASADYGASTCFTYETMAEGLDIHKNKGAMVTVYGFFAAARLFLLMAYDFGWDPFIKTFHWYQDNNFTAASFDRWTRFTTFVERLSEYSGKDIKTEYLTEENWEIFRAYYNNETTEVV